MHKASIKGRKVTKKLHKNCGIRVSTCVFYKPQVKTKQVTQWVNDNFQKTVHFFNWKTAELQSSGKSTRGLGERKIIPDIKFDYAWPARKKMLALFWNKASNQNS